ncbi:PAS domain S-box protein [Bradyrhizobium sp. CB1650]|uniref:PAS domain S-box protein n=1 Tax=Bradyrhizobium sp. CB1650 TaxID=3039153 RepID=UPI0024352D54|nr:PAS domain S-box protein [Bradyrhizobium sp. CB1650]WGD51616.1 PAS domain S-box protein [Bradyrhizobium sp. CB1650]
MGWKSALGIERKSRGSEAASDPADGLANLLARSYEPMLTWRLDGPIEFWNAGAERLYGFAQDEAVGRNSHVLLQTKFPIDLTDLRSQLRDRQHWLGELRHIRKDGSEVVVESRMQLFGESLVLEANRDVTARSEIELTLRESQQRLRFLASIVENSDDVIVSKSLDGVITSWNKAAERIFGFSAREAIGQPITIVIPEDRQSEEREILTRLRRGERIDHFETVRRRKDGSLVAVSLTVSPVKDDSGRIIGASKIARDVTQQKRDQELIATLAREAEHRSKNLLASVMATVNLSQSSSPEELKQSIIGRIRALANVCSLFVSTRWIGAELSAVATQELAPYSDAGGKRVVIDGPQILLEPGVAQAIAVTLHELATNAAKYGALSQPNGCVLLEWSHKADGQLHLLWKERGGPAVHEPTTKGVGSRIIEGMMGQLKGSTRFDWQKDGLVCQITIQV